MIKRCTITGEIISDQDNYSKTGLRMLSPKLQDLKLFAYTAQQQRQLAIAGADKISIQGVQYKLSAILDVKQQTFKQTIEDGQYIIKPQSDNYPELPENEALTMSMAKVIGIEIPVHGLLYCSDDSMSYFIKRFDRMSKNKKFAVEDFSQLSFHDRQTKYNFSMEKILTVIDQFCTFPIIEKAKLVLRVLFNFIIGNEDMHLKNYSLITKNGKTTLAPGYDFINSTIAMIKVSEEIALTINGKKSNLKRRDFIEYYAKQQAGLNDKIVQQQLKIIADAYPLWVDMINHSFLSKPMQQEYLKILNERLKRLEI